MIKWSKETVRKFKDKVLHSDGSSKDIGLAVGFGVFVAWFPIFGTHTALALGGAWLFRLSPALVMVGAFVNNPFTMIPIFVSGFYAGLIVTSTQIPSALSWDANWETLLELSKLFIVPFIIGNLLLGVVAAVISYFLTVRAVNRYRESRAVKASDVEKVNESVTVSGE